MAGKNKTESSGKGGGSGVLKTIADLAFIAFAAGLPIFYLYISNLTELRFREIVLPILIFSSMGWLLYIFLRLIAKLLRKAALLSGFTITVVTNAGILTDVLGYVAVLLISAAVLTAVFFVFIRFVDESTAEKIEFIIAGVVAGLIIFNIVISISQLAENKRLSDKAAAKTASLEEIRAPEEYARGDARLPNMYIFIFDELAGTKCMREIFGYDNAWFCNEMRGLGFSVSGGSTNYKQFTMECLSGLFNLDYVYDYDTDGYLACREQFRNARFFRLMKELGYSLYETEFSGFVDFTPRIGYGKGKEYSSTEDGYNTLDVILHRSLFGPLADALGIFPSNYDLYNEILTYYTLPESYTYKNALTFSYICCPHAPFIYDINGGRVDKANRMKWSEPRYFLEQYGYICRRIVEAMQGIIKNDPDSVILVASDHGVKPNKHLWNGPAATYEQSVDSFFAAYTGGRDNIGDITGLSGANIIRTILNKEYGFNLGMTTSTVK